ncbi:CD48 antigen-like [Lithobates pipiens]
MKMAGLRRLTDLFLLLGALLLGAGAQQTVLKAVGSEVIMKPKYTGNPSEINWKINGNRLVDMEVNSQNKPPMFYRLQDRASIDRTNGVLTIRDLRIEDSGDYRAEALVNNNYQYTDITLTVRACPDKPNITNKTTKENIVLYCESSTPGVTYKWFTQTESVGKGQSYSEPRPEHDVTLTCFVENEVCKKNSSITIPYTPPPPPPPPPPGESRQRPVMSIKKISPTSFLTPNHTYYRAGICN